ncbi:MAG: hypothetical protein ABI741_09905 [Ferruginibacter sp.]
MYFKLFLLVLFIAGYSLNTTAQKVKRKGVTINQVKKKEPVALYTLSQLEGRWQEVKRIPAGSKEETGFTDTLLMKFYENKVELKDATSMRMAMNGVAQIDAPNSLTAAGDTYSIRSLDNSRLVIDDGEFTREMQKKDQFYFETVGKIKLEKDTFPHPESIDINKLKGKWLVYARKAEPGATNAQTQLIRSLDIVSISDDGIAFGQVVIYTSDISRSVPCQLVTKDGIVKIITDKDTWNFYAYKADGKEFVFGETGKLVYYSKH